MDHTKSGEAQIIGENESQGKTPFETEAQVKASPKASFHHWTFQRLGGLDQVVLKTAQDISHLDELDPKLWVALSCPASGLEFDERTLALLDTDKDSRIRIPEILEAVQWTCARLNNPDSLIDAPDVLPLSVINENNPEGKRLLATAKAILIGRNKPDAQYLTQEDVTQSAEHVADTLFNGDGILPPASQLPDDDVRQFIQDALAVVGGVEDASGAPGINQEIAHAFLKTLQDWTTWRNSLGLATSPLGGDTPQAWDLMHALQGKMDDYFLRCDLASYAPQAQAALNVDEKFLVPAQNGLLEDEALAQLPLSKIEPAQPLQLQSGINPVWRDDVERFGKLVSPLLSKPDVMTRKEWAEIKKALVPYSAAVALKPAVTKADVSFDATSSVDQLGEGRIKEILNSDVAKRFDVFAQKDSTTPAAAADIADVERLVIFHKHLYRLLMNFVSFRDFYDLNRSAAFQAGELYIDGRCCNLCVPVTDIKQHVLLADYAELFLLYCQCVKKGAPHGDDEQMLIAAAMTAGDSDLLIEGRHGVFVDNAGQDWDATVVRVVIKPISLRQAIWAPYKRAGKFITDQINKWAGAKDATVMQEGMKKLQDAATPASAIAETAPKFDIGKSVGIFAAIGLALGAIGTAVASIGRALFDLSWWQFPIVLLSLFLLISGPSMVIAGLKLRQRTLGPLLEASGWAINGKMKINYFLGTALTSAAQLPAHTTRNMSDPLKGTRRRYWIAFIIALVMGALAAWIWIWWRA